MTTRSISRSVLLISFLASCGSAQRADAPGGGATIVLVGGDVRTMDPAHPAATAIAIRGEEIIAVGTDAEVRQRAGAQARVIELRGATVTPGLVDAHCHLSDLGHALESIPLRGLPSEAEAVRVTAEAAKARPATEWLIGDSWDQNRWAEGRFPTKASLDAAVSDRPVILQRVDGHALWVNSRALAAAKITASTPDPAGGKILRDSKGEPTGVLVDNAMTLVTSVMPVPTDAVRERWIRAGAQRAIETGLTGVHEMSIDDAMAAVYRRLAGQGALPLRVYAYLHGNAANLERLRKGPEPAVGRFAMRGVKLYADGALGSRGARLSTDYDDEPGNRGLWVTKPEQLVVAVDVATSTGWQIATHAIGDAGITAVLDAYIAAEKKYPGEHRPRIEHLQVIARDDVPRMLDAKAIASMQPTHATSDMPWAEQRVGPDRIKGAYAWRTILDKGIPLAAGSDFPVEEVPPILGLYAAVTRQDAKGQPPDGWYPAQRLTLDEAIAAFTRGAAFAEFAEATRGMLAAGRAADITVFDGKLAPDRTLLERKVALTIVGGQIVYEAKR